MDAQELTALLVLCTATSFTPGPNTTLSTALAANFGLNRAMRFVLAVPVGWGLLFSLCAGGLGALVVAAPALRVSIQIGGIAYLLWLAFKLGRSTSLAQADTSRLEVTFWQGVALQFLNIKAWMLALTLTGGWVIHANGMPSPNPSQRLALVVGVGMAFAFCSNFTYACMGSVLRHWLAQGQRLRWFNRSMASVLVVTAVWMLRS